MRVAGARRGAATVLVAMALAARAEASGFATARFAGDHSTAADGTPAAIYYNPAGLSLLDGQHLMLDATLAFRSARYTRSPDAIDASTLDAVEQAGLDERAASDALSGESKLNDVVLLPFVGVTTDLGMPDSPVRIGAAFFVPFGGQSSWDTTDVSPDFPGAQDGSARWYNIEGTIRSMAGALGVSYRIEAARLSFGVAGNLYFSEVSTLRARNANGTDNLVAGDGSLLEGRSWLDVSGVHFGLGAGVLWEPVEERLWVGASYQSQPGFGTMELSGQLHNTLGRAQPAPPADVIFTQELPDIVRLGVRGRIVPEVELRAAADWTAWSRLRAMCLANEDVSDIDDACETSGDGSLVHTEHAADVIQIFQRRWVDGFGLRVGASYFWGDEVELYGGVGFDSNAIPSSTLDPALFDMAKYSFTLGGTYRVSEHLALSLTLIEVLYLDRDTRGVAGNESFELPSKQPANAGVYEQNTFLVQPAVQLSL
jgi:long-chain fatty acid transport protein